MDTEVLLRVVAVVLAGCLLLSNVNVADWWTWVKSFFKRSPKPAVEQNVSFLEVVESWHQLREQCEKYGLDSAVDKIDEVFPLLNTEA